MNTPTLRWIVVPAIGGLIGAGLAHWMFPLLIWPFGLLAGALAAGFIWSFQDIVRFAPIAARTAWATLKYIPVLVILPITIWKAWQGASRLRKWQWRVVMAITLTWCLLLSGVGYLISLPGDQSTPLGFALLIELLLGFTTTIAVSSITDKGEEDQKIRKLQRGTIIGSPIGPFFLIVWGGKIGFFYLVQFLPVILGTLQEVPQFALVFGKTLFFLVHSKELVVVMLLSLFGGAIGLWVGLLQNTLGIALIFGALGGAIFGFVYHRFVYTRIAYRQSAC